MSNDLFAQWRSLIVIRSWFIDKPRTAPPDSTFEIEGNIVVELGANVLLDRLTDATPTYAVYDNTNALIGVGTSAASPAFSQTDLQAANNASNRHYAAMEAGFPSPSPPTDGVITFEAEFGTSAANFAWREFVLARGTAGAGGSGSADSILNRRVEDRGTKTSSEEWLVTWQIGWQ